jgi:hypothetical protein
MNHTSHAIVNLIHAYNTASGSNKVSMGILHKTNVTLVVVKRLLFPVFLSSFFMLSNGAFRPLLNAIPHEYHPK